MCTSLDFPEKSMCAGVWETIHRLAPEVVGGCRCQDLLAYLGSGWDVRHNGCICGGLLCSQILVAERGYGVNM